MYCWTMRPWSGILQYPLITGDSVTPLKAVCVYKNTRDCPLVLLLAVKLTQLPDLQPKP